MLCYSDGGLPNYLSGGHKYRDKVQPVLVLTCSKWGGKKNCPNAGGGTKVFSYKSEASPMPKLDLLTIKANLEPPVNPFDRLTLLRET